MKALTLTQALRCENAPEETRCRCRCNGTLHGAQRAQTVEQLALLLGPWDPHHLNVPPKPKRQWLRRQGRLIGFQTTIEGLEDELWT